MCGLDGFAEQAYLSYRMTRFLLTLLALLTGLTTLSAPVSARVCGGRGAEIGVLEAPLGSAHVAIAGQQVSGPKARQSALGPVPNCRRPAHLTIYLPTVQLKADRALE
jgi:hypothetical protein